MHGARPEPLPEQLEEFRLLRPLGRGGMGHVHLAHDTLLDRLVAVKLIVALTPDHATRQRFLLEARAAARLAHPNVVAVYRVGELDARPYIVSEYVRGESLDRLPRPQAWTRVIELGVGLARGLAAAHRQGVLHRDIKPANAILAEDGTVKLLDFGLAKLTQLAGGELALLDSRSLAAIGSAPTPPVAFASATPNLLPADDLTDPPRGDRRDSGRPAAEGALADLTQEGAVLGTPYYMAPETLQGAPATRRSDVYSLGALLYELCTGRAPYREVPVEELGKLTRAPVSLTSLVPGVDARLAGLIERCLSREAARRFASGDEVRDALESLLAARSPGPELPPGNPYRGLAAFDAEHRGFYFGRATATGEVVDRLRSEPLVVVAGDSGLGKSSLCRAGVLPAIGEHGLGDGKRWVVIPVVPGRRPLTALAAALAPVLHIGEERVARDLVENPAGLASVLRSVRAPAGGVLLFVDQLEELVTLADAGQAVAVASFLGELAAGAGGVRTLCTARLDVLTRLTRLAGLGDELPRALYLLRPMGAEGLRDAIVRPARRLGVAFESETMVDELVQAALAGQGTLPLLQFALAELWEARQADAGLLSEDSLRKLGGLPGALARHADGVLAGLPAAQLGVARRLLTALVTAEGERVRLGERELAGDDAEAARVLETLLRGRLLVAREDVGGTSYEIAHETLVREWSTLRGWLHDDAERSAQLERLRRAAAEWERLGRKHDALLGPRQLAETADFELRELPVRIADLLAASRLAQRRQRWRRGLGLALAPLLVAAIYAGVIWQQRHARGEQVAEQLRVAGCDLGRARVAAAQVEAKKRAAFLRFDAHDRVSGEKLWAEALQGAEAAERAFAEASSSAETALLIDASRSEARALLADIMYERAHIADRDHRQAARDELLYRMSLYDGDGERGKRWAAPAALVVRTSPNGAELRIERAGPAASVDVGTYRAGDELRLELAPGGYLLIARAPGHAEVRVPLLLRRGETLPLQLRLPALAELPPGFVYIPAGRFLWGVVAEESQRRDYFETVPQHEVVTPAYLIARHETTWAEWLEFLAALPAGEQKERTPRSAGVGLQQGHLELRRLPSGTWQLRLQPGSHMLTAAAGEKLRYPGRKQRAEQDWLRLPVTGISWEDAHAYADWLAQTGRVPRAHLCSDQQWERAARGADGRSFPSGSQLRPEDANINATYGGDPSTFGPDEVGSYPASRSPFGVDDLAGNVFELGDSQTPGKAVAVRGGSYAYDAFLARAEFSDHVEPAYRDVAIGLRICAGAGP